MLKKDAVKHYGSQYYLAKALKINLSAVTRWGKHVPMLRAAQLDQLTGGKLKYDAQTYIGNSR